MNLVATCALGLEELLERELAAIGGASLERHRGAVGFRGGWTDVWRANWRLRTANRVLVELASWPAEDGDALADGAATLVGERTASWDGVDCATLFQPHRTLAVRATASASKIRDVRWVTLRVKDGLVDAQRQQYGRRSSIDRREPDLALRVWLHRDRATLLLDTSGEPLDRRGYRLQTTEAPLRENIAAACVLASEWDRRGPVVDPMCGSGTLLAEAGAVQLDRPAGALRRSWAFERLPGFDAARFRALREEPPRDPVDPELYGVDRSAEAIAAARLNLEAAKLGDCASLTRGDAFDYRPPGTPGLLLVNPPYGERIHGARDQWRRLGDLMKQRYTGWRAVVLAGDPDRGKHIGLRPSRRWPVRNGPLDARILVFDLY